MYQDPRITLLDCKCKQIKLGETIYLLDDSIEVSRGGSCLVYHAWQMDTEGLHRRILLKEFYPLAEGCSGWRHEDGSLLLPDGLQSRMERFLNSYEKCKELFNEEALNQYIVQVQSCPKDNGTAYMVVDYSSGITMDKYMQTCSLFDFFKTVRNLAGVLGALHGSRNQNGKGYVHMDIKPQNILVLSVNPEHQQTRELCRFLDTDSFIHKNRVQAESDLSGTPGYTAPEVIAFSEASDNFLLKEELWETGERADMYSLGAVIHEFIFEGELPEAPYEICHSYEDRLEAYLKKKSRYIPYKSISLIRYLLKRTLAKDPYDRYESMSEIEAEIGKILELIDDKKVLIQDNCRRNPDKILGREQKILELRQKLTDPTLQRGPGRVVIITGIGGIGKSSLAREYASVYAEEYDIKAEISAASARDAIMRIQIVNDPTKGIQDHEENIKNRKEIIVNLCEEHRTLLIIHDYDVSSDPYFPIWSELGCDVILTSRCNWSKRKDILPVITVNCSDFDERTAMCVFEEYYLQDAQTPSDMLRLKEKLRVKTTEYHEEEKLKELLIRINFHPLTMKLIARYMTAIPEHELSPSQVLNDEGIFSSKSHVNVVNNPDWAIIEANVHSHIRNLFEKSKRLSIFCNNDLEALRYMILVPSGTGISAARLGKWTNNKKITIYLNRLKKNGWLEFSSEKTDILTENNDLGVYRMPNILQELLKDDSIMECRTDNCLTFIKFSTDSVWKWHILPQRQAFLEQQNRLVQMIRYEKTESYALLLHWTAMNHNAIHPGGAVDMVLKYETQCLAICRDIEVTNIIGEVYELLGNCYAQKGMWEKSSDYYSMGLEARFRTGELNAEGWILAQHNLSRTCWERGSFDQAIHMLLEAWEVCKEHKETSTRPLIAVSLSLGKYFAESWRFQEGESWLRGAEFFCNEELQAETGYYSEAWRDIFFVYNEFGSLFYKSSIAQSFLAEEAVFNFEKAAQIAITQFGKESYETAYCWNMIANAYVRKGYLETAGYFREKALDVMFKTGQRHRESLRRCIVYFLLDHEEWDDRCQMLWNTIQKEYNDLKEDIFIENINDLLELYLIWAQEKICRGNIAGGLHDLEEHLIMYGRYDGASGDYADACRNYAETLCKYERRREAKYYFLIAESIQAK